MKKFSNSAGFVLTQTSIQFRYNVGKRLRINFNGFPTIFVFMYSFIYMYTVFPPLVFIIRDSTFL